MRYVAAATGAAGSGVEPAEASSLADPPPDRRSHRPCASAASRPAHPLMGAPDRDAPRFPRQDPVRIAARRKHVPRGGRPRRIDRRGRSTVSRALGHETARCQPAMKCSRSEFAARPHPGVVMTRGHKMISAFAPQIRCGAPGGRRRRRLPYPRLSRNRRDMFALFLEGVHFLAGARPRSAPSIGPMSRQPGMS